MVLERIGLTGASGMVGRHLLAQLAEKGVSCAATSRRRPSGGAVADWRPSDMADWRWPEDLDPLFDGVDAVIHAGACIPSGATDVAALFDINLRATLVLGQWALRHGKLLIFLSSCSVYGETAGIVDESAPFSSLPLGGLYGLSKIFAEQALGHLRAQGLACAILRPTAVYGTGMPGDKLVAAWLGRAQRGEVIALSPPAEDSVNLLHSADLARAALAALSAGAEGIFNIRGPGEVTMEDLARGCVQVAGRGTLEFSSADGPVRPPVSRFRVDGAAADRAFAYRPAIGLEQGLSLLAAGTCLPGEHNS